MWALIAISLLQGSPMLDAWWAFAGLSTPDPPAFRDLGLAEGDAASRAEHTTLIVVVRSLIQFDEWVIWGHSELSDRLRDDFVTVQFSADARAEALRRHRVVVFPTALAFRDGTLVGRLDRPLNAGDVGEWLDLLPQATAENPVRRSGLRSPESYSEFDQMGRCESVLAEVRLEEAAECYAACVARSVNGDAAHFGGIAYHFLGRIRAMIEVCEECRIPLQDAVNTLEPFTFPGTGFNDSNVHEYWTVVGSGLVDTPRLLEWVQVAAREGTFAAAASTYPTSPGRGVMGVTHTIAEDLARARLFRLAALVDKEPLLAAEWTFRQWRTRRGMDRTGLGERLRKWELDNELSSAVCDLSRLHLTALAGGRIDDAREILCLAIEAENSDSTRIRLVADALHAHIVHPMHLELLDACARKRQFQRQYVEAALRDWPRVWETPIEPNLTTPASP